MIGRFFELFASLAAALSVLKAVKLGAFGVDTRLRADEVALAASGAGAVAVSALASPWLGALAAAVVAAGGFALWLDALLFRIFTIELRTGGLGTVVISMLLRELAELTFARRFLASRRAFALLPLIVLAACLRAALPSRYGALGWVCLLTATGGLAWALIATPSVALGATLRRRMRRAPLRERRDPPPALARRVPRESELFGIARGSDVVLITFESLGRAHVPHLDAPFLRSVLSGAETVASAAHFSPSPTTNNAHGAWYWSGYSGERGQSGAASLLAAAGWRTVYLSAVKTESYGLRKLLHGAGFQEIVDAESLQPHPLDGGVLSDYSLLASAIDRLERARSNAPLFLHLHTTNTHVPYRVIDRARFARFDHADDRGRFFDALGEADFLVSAFLAEIARRGIVRSPLLAISSDHGQSFGELGYQSHGSAVSKEQVNVPFALRHESLSGAPRSVPWSSHFDVLPTILDLLGVADPRASHGEPIFHAGREPCLLLWAGHPSRTRSASHGLVQPGTKLLVDLVLERCFEMTWEDEIIRDIGGRERDDLSARIQQMLAGVT